ncbi:hypothetical protein ACROYT_G027136 [Oculina patagonica]
MAYLNRALAVFVVCSVLAELVNVAAAASGTSTIHVVPSPTVSKNGSTTSNATTFHNATTVPSHNMTVTPQNMTVMPSHNITVMPHNSTVKPSHNKTVMPHNMTVTPHNMTVMPHNSTVAPSHNKTVMPHNMTVTPSHNMTVMPHNMTVTPSHNMTVMPHNSTVAPPHNMTITPSSAHTVMPTSSVHPTPAPERGNFSVKENGSICLFAYMAAKFDITIASKKLSLELPTDATQRGECQNSGEEPYITLDWRTKEGYSCNFTMHFVIVGESLGASTQRWAAANLTFSLKMKSGVSEPIYTFHSKRGALDQLSAHVGYAYECLTAPTNFKLTANNSNVDVTLSKIDFQPFNVKNGHLGNVEECTPPTSPTTARPQTTPTKKSESHVVAIAVGCSLAGLVIIVAIGYMIGRRRSRNQQAGYRKL